MAEFATLVDLLPRLKKFNKRRAVVALERDRVESWTYAKLADRASHLAAGLAAAGVEPGEHIALFAEPSPQWIAACLGVLNCGAVAVPLDVQSNDKSLEHALRDSGAKYVFTTSRLLERLPRSSRCAAKPILLDEPARGHRVRGARSWHEFSARLAKEGVNVSPDDRAVLFYTSGTTGTPKGVPLTHRNLAFQLEAVMAADIVQRGDRVLLPLPLHHVYPFTIGLLTPLALGLPIILPASLTGPELMRAMRKGRVTIIIGVPRLYRALVDGIEARAKSAGRLASMTFRLMVRCSIALAHLHLHVGRRLFRRVHREIGPQLRVVASGGAPLEADLAWKLEGLGWQIATGYGLTETSPLLTIGKPGEHRIGSVGRPIDGVEVTIEPVAPDDERQQKPRKRRAKASRRRSPKARERNSFQGEGEILARGPSVFRGYHHLTKETEQAFTSDGRFRTGDLGYFDRSGALIITGRVKTLIVLEGGEKIQPDDLEDAYRNHSEIAEIGVLSHEGKLVAVVRPRHISGKGERDDQATHDRIHAALAKGARGGSSYRRISEFALTRSPLPRTRLGKIRREELAQLYEQLERHGGKAERAGPISEEEMAADDRALLDQDAARQVWAWLVERFSDQPLSPDANLHLDLGIDSMEWLNLTLEIRQHAGIELSDEAIGRVETVRDLLHEVAENPQSKAAKPAADPLEEPEKILGSERKRWLAPLGPIERLASRLLYGIDWLLARGAFHLSVDGRENVPADGPVVFAPNHVSYLDSGVLAAALDYELLSDTYWAAWSGMANGPIFRVLWRLCHVVPIDHQRSAASSLAFGAAILRDKHKLVWYPEGGHSETGKLGQLRPGIGLLLDRYRVPVVPVSLEGTREALPPGHYLPRPRHVRVTFGKPLDPRELEQRGHGKEPHERITSALHDAMARLQRQHGHDRRRAAKVKPTGGGTSSSRRKG